MNGRVSYQLQGTFWRLSKRMPDSVGSSRCLAPLAVYTKLKKKYKMAKLVKTRSHELDILRLPAFTKA